MKKPRILNYTPKGDCYPLNDTACRVDPKELEDIDPTYGGPTREVAETRFGKVRIFRPYF